MKEITREMIRLYKLKQLGIDFMGYEYNKNQVSYHHLIIPRRNGGAMTIQNGAILMRNTGHDYLHKVENVDYDVFCAITSEMIDENVKGFLDPVNLAYIDDILSSFEREHSGDRTRKGQPLIKEEYTRRLVRERGIR